MIDLKEEAMAFAWEHDTRNHATIQIVEEAMKHGYAMGIKDATQKIAAVREDLEKQRRRNVGPDSGQSKTILLGDYPLKTLNER